MGHSQRHDEPAAELPPAMATKGLGWSGREAPAVGGQAPRGEVAATKGPLPGPGMREDRSRRFGRTEAEAAFAGLSDPFAEVPDDLPVDASQLLAGSELDEVLADLDRDLVALWTVKTRVREIASLLLIDRLRRSIGLEADAPTLHMCFTGNPGTGKTTVAKKMAEILFRLGYVRKGHVVSASRDDLVGQYVGHTAPKTREVIKRAMGGVLFIDEAYHIYRVDNERDYGQETVEILLEVMENNRADLVVIMAGYKHLMDRFFSDVPGLSSRIAHHIDFPDYSLEELVDIAHLMAAEQRYRFSQPAEEALREYLQLRMSQPRFGNGRTVRNALDRFRMRQAIRLYEALEERGIGLTKGDLVTIEADDVYRSRVFEGGSYPGGAELDAVS